MDVGTAASRITLAGAVAQVTGLAVDLGLHAADPGLAAKEGLLTLTNAGHALLVAGIALVVAGTALALVARGRSGAVRPVWRTGAAALLAAALLAGAGLAAQTSLAHGHARGHDDDQEAVGPAHSSAAPATPATSAMVPGQELAAGGPGAEGDPPAHGHGDGTFVPDQPVDPAARVRLGHELVAARAAALRYPTGADATAAGYRMVTRYIPRIGAHYIKVAAFDEVFDPDVPEMLLYDGDGRDARIVGLSYLLRSAAEPRGFAGPNDHWHRHIGLCFDPRSFLVVGNGQTSDEECSRRNGIRLDGSDAWMVHAWVVPGWESPLGVFSAEHPDLR